MHFMNKHHKVSFSIYFIFDRIIRVLVTFWERGHFVMLIIMSLHLINLHFWTYLVVGGKWLQEEDQAKDVSSLFPPLFHQLSPQIQVQTNRF